MVESAAKCWQERRSRDGRRINANYDKDFSPFLAMCEFPLTQRPRFISCVSNDTYNNQGALKLSPELWILQPVSSLQNDSSTAFIVHISPGGFCSRPLHWNAFRNCTSNETSNPFQRFNFSWHFNCFECFNLKCNSHQALQAQAADSSGIF